MNKAHKILLIIANTGLSICFMIWSLSIPRQTLYTFDLTVISGRIQMMTDHALFLLFLAFIIPMVSLFIYSWFDGIKFEREFRERFYGWK